MSRCRRHRNDLRSVFSAQMQFEKRHAFFKLYHYGIVAVNQAGYVTLAVVQVVIVVGSVQAQQEGLSGGVVDKLYGIVSLYQAGQGASVVVVPGEGASAGLFDALASGIGKMLPARDRRFPGASAGEYAY